MGQTKQVISCSQIAKLVILRGKTANTFDQKVSKTQKGQTMKLAKLWVLLLFFCIAQQTVQAKKAKIAKASWNFMVLVAANNNLYRYALQNIKEMQSIGSNKHINIFVQIDNYGKKEVTRYKIEKNKQVTLEILKKPPLSLSGTPENLFDFAKSVISKYPADHQALVLWNHGAGIVDPNLWSRTLPHQRDEHFFLNPETSLYEINKNFLTRMGCDENGVPFMGIAFNDIGHTYLTNSELKATLEKINTKLLKGKKLDILGMDACHMAMVEVGSQIKHAAHYMIGSEEIEPGAGWDYVLLLKPFLSRTLSPIEFAKHIVSAYGTKYNHRFAELTQSATDLTLIDPLEKNIDAASILLLKLVGSKSNNAFFKLIKTIRTSSKLTTAFLDANYIDLGHFYTSVLDASKKYKAPAKEKKNVETLKTVLAEGLKLLSGVVVHNSVGSKIQKTRGLSIYFPTRSLHSSYLKTEFAKNTNWCNFLVSFLKQQNQKKPRRP